MGKSSSASSSRGGRQKSRDATTNEDCDNVLSRMEIAQAVLQKDIHAMREILQKALNDNNPCTTGASNNKVIITVLDDVSIEKSLGESFTGGRSTPVYHVEATIARTQTQSRKTVQKKRHFVVKLVVMPDNDSTAEQQRRESYAVEGRFYSSRNKEMLQLLRDDDLRLTIPRVFKNDLDPIKAWPCFCILMNDVSQQFPVHPEFLSVRQAKSALIWVARFHAACWGLPAKKQKESSLLWTRGGFWTPKDEKGQMLSYAAVSSTTWQGTVRFLEQKHRDILTPRTKTLGQRIEKAGQAIASFLSAKSCTVIHGDFKAANMFLKRKSDSGDDDGGGLASSDHVAVLDFQYTGGGVGAEDVAYLLYPDARGDFCAAETELLQTFHDEFISQLIAQRKGGPSTLSFEALCRYYELARLDMTRHWLSKHGWIASTSGEAQLVRALEDSMDRLDGGSTLGNQNEYMAALERFV